MSRQRAEESLGFFLALPLDLQEPRALLRRVWSLGRDMTAYDAAYVALAEAIEAPLLTLDGALARAVSRHTDVTVVGM